MSFNPGKNSINQSIAPKVDSEGIENNIDSEDLKNFQITNFFYQSDILYHNLNDPGYLHFGSYPLSGSLNLVMNTEGVYLKDADLSSNSDFIDKQVILNGMLNLIFKLNYESWLETAISIRKNYFWGTNHENMNYFQSERPYLINNIPDFYINLFFIKFKILNSGQFNAYLLFGEQLLTDIYLAQNQFYNLIYPDKIEGLLLMLKNNEIGKFNLVLIDILNLYENWLEIPYKYHDQPINSSDVIGNYNGDVLSFRSGIFYETPNLLNKFNNIQWNIYMNTFLTRYGPVVSGKDRSGKSGNISDNDYLLHYGIGTFLRLNSFKIFIEICRSEGIDRKLPNILGYAADILANGYFFRTGIFTELFPLGTLQHAFHSNLLFSDGPSFDAYGNKKSYGFVASGNHESGGFLLNNFWGFRPYALSLNNGFVNNLSYGYYHCSGALVLDLGYSVLLNKLIRVEVQSWFIFDTSLYNDTHSIFSENKPYSSFGKRYIGNESMLSVLFSIKKVLQLFFSVDAFVPGEIYQYFNHGIYNEKNDNFYGISGGLRIQF